MFNLPTNEHTDIKLLSSDAISSHKFRRKKKGKKKALSNNKL
jgi:hypothetical protein